MRTRTVTAIVALLLFVPIVVVGALPMLMLVYLLSFTALYEILKMNRIHIFSIPGILSLIALFIIMMPNANYTYITFITDVQVDLIIVMALLMLSFTVISKNRFSFVDMGFCVLAVAYIGIGFMYFYETREEGLIYILYALLIVWMTDTGAYFAGRAFGRRKLWPQISPNKTLEGFLGGIASSLVLALLFSVTGLITNTHFLLLLVITMILSVAGQLGDLVESALKRHFDVKDSGRVLPGHGGILDRFDSFLFVLPLMNILPLMS